MHANATPCSVDRTHTPQHAVSQTTYQAPDDPTIATTFRERQAVACIMQLRSLHAEDKDLLSRAMKVKSQGALGKVFGAPIGWHGSRGRVDPFLCRLKLWVLFCASRFLPAFAQRSSSPGLVGVVAWGYLVGGRG